MARRDELTDVQFSLIEDLLPEKAGAGPVERPQVPTRRHLPGPAQRRAVARAPRAVRQVTEPLRPIPPLASGRHPRPHPEAAPHDAERRSLHRPGPLVRRRHLDPSQPLRGVRRRGKKVPGEPADHVLGRSRDAFGTKGTPARTPRRAWPASWARFPAVSDGRSPLATAGGPTGRAGSNMVPHGDRRGLPSPPLGLYHDGVSVSGRGAGGPLGLAVGRGVRPAEPPDRRRACRLATPAVEVRATVYPGAAEAEIQATADRLSSLAA